MTIDELLKQVPDEWQPVVIEYGPIMLKWSHEELWAWIELIIRGDTQMAYRKLLMETDNNGILAAWDDVNAEWEAANRKNERKMELQRDAAMAVMKVVLGIALALVGL